MTPAADDPPADDPSATRTGLLDQVEFAPGAVLGERYRIDGLLGIGGMGVVHRATDLTLQVPVALKLLRPELAHRGDAFERFRQELLLARQVSSPRVVRIHDLARHDGHWLISMDLVDGEALDHRLDREGALPIEDALRIARQIAEGLAAAHACGVIHRDLKPANILLDRNGDARISDFGVARSLAGSGGTRSGAIVGTPDYLSPEQVRGAPADARSDLYALGLMLYEMLAGAPPFPAGTLAETLAQRMLRTPPSVALARPDAPDWLARLVARLLRPQPAHRLQTAQAVLQALDARALPRDLRDALPGSRRARWTLAALCAIALAAFVALGALGWRASWNPLRAPATTAAATPVVAPLDRLLVLPLRGVRSADDPDLDAALSLRLRQTLAAIPGHAVVDGERTRQALRVRDPGGLATPDPLAVARAAAASRVLETRWIVGGRGVLISARLLGADVAPQAWQGPPATDPASALAAWLAQPATASALGLPAGAATLPAMPPAALRALGQGVRKRADGDLEAAAQAFETATAAAPDDATAWSARADLADQTGQREQAVVAIVQAQRAPRLPAGLRARLAAQRAALEGDTGAAIAQWTAWLRDTPDDAAATLALARAAIEAGDFDAAGNALRGLSSRDPDDPRIWFLRGKLAILQGDARPAVDEYLVRALVAFKRGRDRYGEAETVNALGIGYGRLGQTADAAEQYRRAIALRRALGDRRGLATSLRNLANVLSLTGDYAAAGHALEEARTLSAALGDRSANAAVDNELGLLAEERGDHRRALEAFQRALRTWQQIDDRHAVAETLDSIGFAHYQLGSYGDAQVYWQQAADAYAALGERTGRVRTRQNLGLLWVARGRWKEARAALDEALKDAERLQMVEEAAVSRRNLAELALRQGHLRDAVERATEAEAAFGQREDSRGLADAGLLRVEALLEAGDRARAGRALEALAPAVASASSEQRATAEWLHARLAAAAGDAAAAGERLRQAHRLAEASGVRALQLRIALSEAGQRPQALSALDAPTAALGNAGLRLDWLQAALAQAIARGDVRGAGALYDEAAALLRAGDALHAAALHRLGAEARDRAGDHAGAEAARARAAAASAAADAAAVDTASAVARGGGR